MVEAIFGTAELMVARTWESFKAEYLLLPPNPQSESLTDWRPAHAALDSLPMVGEATAWYMLRNLYGAPVFKPDVHICAIAKHFFPQAEAPLEAMTVAVRELWEHVCQEKRLLPVHMGEVDFVLWWYRQSTGVPEVAVVASC
jgi:endonuclease III